jgi:hypothetical protein
MGGVAVSWGEGEAGSGGVAGGGIIDDPNNIVRVSKRERVMQQYYSLILDGVCWSLVLIP